LILFDIGWTELVVVACVAVLVVGPKDLPKMLRAFGKTVANMRRMAGDFQRQFDEALKEAEIDEVRKTAQSSFKPLEDARKSLHAYEKQVRDSVNEKVELDAPSPDVTDSRKTPAKNTGKRAVERTEKKAAVGSPVEKRKQAPAQVDQRVIRSGSAAKGGRKRNAVAGAKNKPKNAKPASADQTE
jgi:sec-independent protein translocase protein TatB